MYLFKCTYCGTEWEAGVMATRCIECKMHGTVEYELLTEEDITWC